MRNPLWEAFLDDVRIAQQELGCQQPGCSASVCKHLWYRGHADCVEYKLLPSLLRHKDGLSKERTLFEKYEQAATAIKEGWKRGSAWEMLFEMQHYYIPTRLLDWTSVLGVAVFFAILKDTGQDACVYVLNPSALNLESTGHSEIKHATSKGFDYHEIYLDQRTPLLPRFPIAIEPAFQNPRILAQKGKFTCHNDRIDPLDKQCPKCVKQVILPRGARSGAQEFLHYANLNQFSIFPDMGGLAPSSGPSSTSNSSAGV